MTDGMKVTGEQVKDAVTAAAITRIDHHECSMCGYMMHYAVQDGDLFFCGGCECAPWSLPQPRTWDSAADRINMQSREDIRDDLLRMFGFAQSSEDSMTDSRMALVPVEALDAVDRISGAGKVSREQFRAAVEALQQTERGIFGSWPSSADSSVIARAVITSLGLEIENE